MIKEIEIPIDQLYTDYRQKLAELYTVTQIDKVKSLMPNGQTGWQQSMSRRAQKKNGGTTYSLSDMENIIESINNSYSTFKEGRGKSPQANSQGIVRYSMFGTTLKEILEDYGYFDLAKKIKVGNDVKTIEEGFPKVQKELQDRINEITQYHNKEYESNSGSVRVPVQINEDGNINIPDNIAEQVKAFINADELLQSAFDSVIAILLQKISEIKKAEPANDDERVAEIKRLISSFEDPSNIRKIFV